MNLTVTASGVRLDKFLAENLPDFSRARLQKIIDEGAVKIDGAVCTDRSQKLREGQIINLHVPEPKPSHLIAADIPLKIAYEDEYLLVLDKPSGMTVHPGAGTGDDTLVHALLAHCGDSLSGIGGVSRPGIVHRLDRDTSGLMVVAKDDATHRALSDQLQERELKRYYLAIVWGTPEPMAGIINANIGRHPIERKKMAVLKSTGRGAITHYRTIQNFADYKLSLVECRLETGRTHQIRLHMQHKGWPLLGDKTYGLSQEKQRVANFSPELQTAIKKLGRQALHSWKIAFTHPHTDEYIELENLPEESDLGEILKLLRTTQKC